MTDVARLERALRAADAAGDTDAARQFAMAIRSAGQAPAAPTQQEPPQRSFGEDLGRQVGLAGRYAVEGGLGLGNLLARIPATAANGYLEIANAAAKPFGGSVDFRFQDPMKTTSDALTSAGLPQPETRGEEVIGNMSRGVAGAGTGMGLGGVMGGSASPVAQGLGQSMQAQPLVQGVAGVTGPAAADLTKEMGGGAVAQTIAGLAGGMAPGVGAALGPMATRGAFRGGEAGRQAMEQNIDTFAGAGTTPSVGQATQGRVAQAAEGLLARAPGGGGVMASKAASQAEDLSQGIEARAAQLMKKTTGEQAGRQIERGVKGEGGFIERFKAKQGELYDELDKHIPDAQRVDVSKTRDALKDLNMDITDAENLSKWFKNSRIQGIEGALKADLAKRPELDPASVDILAAIKKVDPAKADSLQAEIFQDGKLPYEAMKKLRTLVGREIDNSTIASDVPRSKWKALYGALSQDLGGAAKEAGPKAEQAWSRANSYTRAGMDRLDAISSVIDKNGGPEAVFKAATANTKEGATTLRAVMQSLDGDGQKAVSATVLRRLGLAKEGNQNELGDRFSTESFLTNWGKLSPEAKRTLFDRYGPKFRGDMDQVAEVAANLRKGSQVFKNPSGTAQALNQTSTVGGIVLAAILGHTAVAGAGIAGVAASNVLARGMTNPRFVRWLAQSTKHPVAHAPSMINSLVQTARQTGDEELAQMAVLTKDIYQNNDH